MTKAAQAARCRVARPRRPCGRRARRRIARRALTGVRSHGLRGPAGPARAGSQGPAERTPDAARRARAVADAQRRPGRRGRALGPGEVPLTAPPPPPNKPKITTREGFEVDGPGGTGLPPVFTTVPTEQKVVFLTIDDGAEKDPAFLRMMSELKIPYTAFLSDYLIKDDYGYFKKMQAQRGHPRTTTPSTTPTCPASPTSSSSDEICGMQDVMEKRYGKRPSLFRPPFGNYNQDTLRAAKSCGIKYAPAVERGGLRRPLGVPRGGPEAPPRATSSSPTSGAATTGRARCPT